jgi:hypothetical protein
MSSLYTPFFEVLQNNHTVSGAANNQTFVLRDSGASVASKNVGFGPSQSNQNPREIAFVGGNNTVTFSSVSSDFDELMVKTEMGSTTSLVNTVLFTFSTKSPNGNNVDLNRAAVSFPSENEGLYRMAIENWADPAHRVQLIDSGGTAQDHSDEAFTVDSGQSEVTSDNSPIRISAGSSYTADEDRVQYDSNTLGGFVDMSTGTLNGNSISLNSGDAVEITGSPAITTSISL